MFTLVNRETREFTEQLAHIHKPQRTQVLMKTTGRHEQGLLYLKFSPFFNKLSYLHMHEKGKMQTD